MMIKTLYVYGARAYNVRQHWNKDLYYIFVEFLSAYFERELLMLSPLCTALHRTAPHRCHIMRFVACFRVFGVSIYS